MRERREDLTEGQIQGKPYKLDVEANEYIKAEWIPEGCELWVVNGPRGRRLVCIPSYTEDKPSQAKKQYVECFR